MQAIGLTKSERRQERVLLDYLAQNQGAAISVLNVGRANNATTYRGEFCDASADLYKLYRVAGINDPIKRMLSKFLETNIKTCRQNEFNEQNIKYFHKNFLAPRIRAHKYIILHKLLATSNREPK
jgi:hypothetical protein